MMMMMVMMVVMVMLRLQHVRRLPFSSRTTSRRWHLFFVHFSDHLLWLKVNLKPAKRCKNADFMKLTRFGTAFGREILEIGC